MSAKILERYLQSTLAEASYTKDHDNEPEKQFMLGSIGKVHVCNLDRCHMKVGEIWKVCHNDKGYVGKDFCTADALYEASVRLSCEKTLYFIEFKAQPSHNVDEDSIWAKAFESLYAASLGPLGGWTMEEIRQCSEFVLVVKSITDKTKMYYGTKKDFDRISDPVLKWAGRKDGEGMSIYFGLEQFKKRGFYRDVHTFSEEQFLEWARDRLV